MNSPYPTPRVSVEDWFAAWEVVQLDDLHAAENHPLGYLPGTRGLMLQRDGVYVSRVPNLAVAASRIRQRILAEQAPRAPFDLVPAPADCCHTGHPRWWPRIVKENPR